MKTELAFRHKKDQIKGPYRYTACGLDNVYLLNGYELYQLEDGEGVSVHDLEDLHRAIGRCLAKQDGPLQPKELRWFRLHLDWTQDKLAEILACTPEAVTQWEKGECAPSEKNDMFIRLLYLDHIDDGAGFPTLLERLSQSASHPPTSWMMDQAAT